MNFLPQRAIEQMIKETKALGHTMIDLNPESPHSAVARCCDCGVTVRITYNSTPGWFCIDWCECRCPTIVEIRKGQQWRLGGL